MATEVRLPAGNWRPRKYQHGFWNYMQTTPYGARAILCHHRRAGKDHTAVNWTAVASQLRVGLYIHLLPYANQARRVIWNGIDRNGRKFLDAFPEELIESKSDLEMRLKLKNGSIYQVLGADDPDKLVGINAVGVVFSEYALMDPMVWALIQPILAENGGWAIFPSTPRGRNHFHKLIYGDEETNTLGAINNPRWYFSLETAKTTGVISEKEIDEVRNSGVEEAVIQQEFYCSFDAPLAGAYYEKQMAEMEAGKRITEVPFEPELEVHTAWDLGMDDSTSIWVFQMDRQKNIRIIDYLEENGQGLAYYIRELDKRAVRGDWVFGYHFGPHDLMVREMGTGKTRLKAAQELGLRFTPIAKHELADGINLVRQTLPRVYIDKKLTKAYGALKGYRKEWNERLKCYSDKPRHDQFSHGADAFRYLCQGAQTLGLKVSNRKPQEYAKSDHDPFA